jgi:hypothetical protein
VVPAEVDGGPFLATLRSALAASGVVATEVLFAAFGSAVAAVAVAVLATEPVAFGATCTTSANVAETPDGSVAMVQVVAAQANVGPLVCVCETNVVFAGSVSVSDTVCAFDGPLFTSAIVYVTFVPGAALAGPVLVTARSALVVTVEVAVEVLLAAFGSLVAAAIVAVLAIEPVAFGASCATSVNVAVAPAANVARVQFVVVQVNAGPEVCVSETNVVFAGSVSLMTTFEASNVPLFVAVIVHVTFAPAVAVAGPVFAIARSVVTMVVVAVDVLLALFGSAVAVVAVAVLVIVPVAVGLMCTTNANVAEVPAASVAIVQLFAAPVVQVNAGPAVCANETNVVFAGSASASATVCAFDGPLFVSVIV